MDDQLVKSDDSRMGWFRALLNEKSQILQIIVSHVNLVTTLQRHRWYATVRAFVKTRAMGSSERSTLGGLWASIDSQSPRNLPRLPGGDSPATRSHKVRSS
jgi:hypothetical protein